MVSERKSRQGIGTETDKIRIPMKHPERSVKSFRASLFRATKSVAKMSPALAGVVLITGMVKSAVPGSFYSALFRGGPVQNALIGSSAGSILAGNPVTSYVIGAGLLERGVGLVAVTSFIVAWVTVGLVQLPAEAGFLGRRFSIARNISAFIFSVIVAVVCVFILEIAR